MWAGSKQTTMTLPTSENTGRNQTGNENNTESTTWPALLAAFDDT
jgi:hypothetical protein